MGAALCILSAHLALAGHYFVPRDRVTLTPILEGRRSDRENGLYCLPLVFLIWDNCHIQVIYGIFVVGLFVGANPLARLRQTLRV